MGEGRREEGRNKRMPFESRTLFKLLALPKYEEIY